MYCSPLCAAGTLQTCFHTVSLRAVCPASSPKAAPMSSELSQSQEHWPLKLQALNPTHCKNSQNSCPFVFQAIVMGICFPCAFPCVIVYLSPFSVTVTPSLPQWAQSISLPSHVFTITSFDVATTLSLVMESVLPVFRFLGYLDVMIVIIVFVELGKPRVLLFHHHLSLYWYKILLMYVYKCVCMHACFSYFKL